MQTKASFSRAKQGREFAQFDALEKRLERWSMPKIRKDMNQAARDILRDYQIGGIDRVRNISVQEGSKKLEQVLLNTNDKTIKESIRLLKKQNPKEAEQVELIRKDLEEAYKKQAKKASKQVMNATYNRVKKIDEQDLSHQDKQKAIRKDLRKSNSRRSRLISETEIGSVTAEANDDVNKKVLKGSAMKVWVTRRDSKVRDPHQYAEGQTVDARENFVVGGEECPYPRYRGLSAKNRINCRCRVRWVKI